MKKIFDFFKTRKMYHYIRYILGSLFMIPLYWLNFWYILGILGVMLIFILINFISGLKLKKRANGNGMISGGRGSGKGQLLNKIILKDKTKPFVNIPYFTTLCSYDYVARHFIEQISVLNGFDKKDKFIVDMSINGPYGIGKIYVYEENMYYHCEMLESLAEYFNSIAPLTITNFIIGNFPAIKKLEKFEGRNVYVDDINTYMPNWADVLLKRHYESLPPFLAINRHAYNAYCMFTTQDHERPYKIIKELQTDFSIEMQVTYGYGFWWNCIPILCHMVMNKYVYYELPKSVGMLPFKAVGAANEMIKGAYLTSGQATKEVYEATNGKIRYGSILQLKKKVQYDTRYFHRVLYGVGAPK